jgi:nitrogen fixation NifU-like protein
MILLRRERPGVGRTAYRPFTISCMYSSQMLDHFQNPRNPGELAGADAIAEIENPACGDVLRLSLKIDSGRIAGIRFKAKGCVPAMACASALTELVAGRTVDEGRALPRETLIAAVGGLPQASEHAAQLALDTLAAALRQLKGQIEGQVKGDVES